MTSGVLIILILLGLLSAGLAWRYYHILRDLQRITDIIRRHSNQPPPRASGGEAALAAVRAFAQESGRQLSETRAERDRLGAVLDQMTDGVLIADGGGQVQYSNPAARRILEAPEPVGRSVTQVLREHQLVDSWNRSRHATELHSEALEIPTRRQFLQLIVMPDQHSGGSLILIQDLTRIRRLETVRRDFVSNISHELRTPLASLRALAETLQSGAIRDPQAGPRFLERMLIEVDALSQMSQELLDLSRIESGQVDLQPQDLSPRELLQSAAERMKVQAERAHVELGLECPIALPAVRADRLRIEQVLVNLIHNAVKFTPPGGKVTLIAQAITDRAGVQAEGPHAVCFSVQDTGLGIPADDLPRIFERFYRVDRSRASGGTGLGLSIARHIVEAHNGRIWAESVQAQGSTIHFTLPAG